MLRKAAWFHQLGEPQVLVVEETAPTPGPGEVLVAVRAVGFNHVRARPM